MGFFSFKSLATDSNFDELLGMIYFSLCWMEIVLWIHRTSNYKWFFSGLLPLTDGERRWSHRTSHYKWFFSGFLPLTVTLKTTERWISLVVRSWTICLPMRRTRVQPLVWEDSHAMRQLSLCTTAAEAHLPGARAPQRERPLQGEAGTPPQEAVPARCKPRNRTQQQRPSTAKINNNSFKENCKVNWNTSKSCQPWKQDKIKVWR